MNWRDFDDFCGTAALLLAFGFLLFLSGCATDRETGAAPPATASVPVAVSCLPADLPTAPALTSNADLLALTPRARYLRIASEREALQAWRARVEPLLSACR